MLNFQFRSVPNLSNSVWIRFLRHQDAVRNKFLVRPKRYALPRKRSSGLSLPRRNWCRVWATLWLLFCLSPRWAGLGYAQLESLESPLQASSLPPNAENPIQRLEELVRQQQWEQAARLTNELLQEDYDDPVLHYWVGVVRWQQGDRVGAVQALRLAEELDLDTASLHKTLGMVYYGMRQFILFKHQMEKAIARDPGDHQPHYQLGRYFLSIQNNSQLALEFLEKAIELSPDHAESVYYKGYCLELLEREEEALRSYQSAIHLLEGTTDRFSGPYEGMARLLLNRDIERALGWARKAIQLQPELDANHLVLAKIYERLGKLSQAVEELQETIRLNPRHTSAHYILFRLYKRLGHSEEAEAELSIFRKLKAVYGDQ